MNEIVAMFFERTFEGPITEEMLQIGYNFPIAELEDYVISVIATPYQEFVNYVHEFVCPKRIDNASAIPQTSSYDLCTYGVCKVLNAIEDPGVTVLDFGRFLYPSGKRNVNYQDIKECSDSGIKEFAQKYGVFAARDKDTYMCIDQKERKKGAIVKIAENQLKGAEFHGLVYELEGKWFLTCIGRIYSTLDEEMQHALSARTLLREPFYWKIIGQAVDQDVNIRPYIESVCNPSTTERRLSSSQNFFNICIEQCKIEGIKINRIYAQSDKPQTINDISKAPPTKSQLPEYSTQAIFDTIGNGDNNGKEITLEHYKKAFSLLKVAQVHGKPAPHKALLLIVIINMIESGYRENRFELTEQMEQYFIGLYNEYIDNSLHTRPNICMPYFHLQHEGFWHLIPKDEQACPKTLEVHYSKSWMNRMFSHAEVDGELFDLLIDDCIRAQLRVLLINTYLK